jgi:hypothetical protein
LCDAAFKYAQGHDWLVTDYFNLTLNHSFTTYEIGNPIRIQLTIPDDLIQPARHWRMVCVSRNGSIYSFDDEDTSDNTITFSPNRFYAYAMCYNDIQPSQEEEIVEEPEENPDVIPEPEIVEAPATSAFHSAAESQTSASAIHSADASSTSYSAGIADTATGENAKLKSDQKSAVEQADGATIPLISL